jgi:asparagine synthetase B (glutamine-hydrolysing)
VYDHIEIGHSLKEDHGTTLTESTDTAVILGLYLLYGPTVEFFSRLNGEFAFIIWDAQRRKLVAVRDRCGVKPLFWYHDSARLVFSSEVKGILSVDGVERKFSTGTYTCSSRCGDILISTVPCHGRIPGWSDCPHAVHLYHICGGTSKFNACDNIFTISRESVKFFPGGISPWISPTIGGTLLR